ncbi:MAG: hypothetical protein Q8K70_09965 [Bacteroidota bacterium]|nr:hypothetical protein [Bacteroidota bacterium]
MNSHTFSPDSKVWTYYVNGGIPETEMAYIIQYLTEFCFSWTAHNQALKATFEIIDQHFIVLIVDESQNLASGCSIDKSTHAMKHLSEKLQVNLFDRLLLPYLVNGKIETIHFNNLKESYLANTINDSTQFYNLNISKFGELNSAFLLPFYQHWLYKFVK